METMDIIRTIFPGMQSFSFIVMQCTLYGIEAESSCEEREKTVSERLERLKNMATNLMFAGFSLWLFLGLFREDLEPIILIAMMCMISSIGTLLSITGILLYLKNRKYLCESK